tara:strand:- start:1019 stop:1591 length:573 start_codon:yes stop_codon:yes gene_type:complete
MNNIIENYNNDFYHKLAIALCTKDSDDELCLISNTPLKPDYIKLECGHKFNYISLFKEISRQKNPSFNHSEIQKLKKNQIKCPYCRHIQNGLLPFYSKICEKKLYVNWPPKYIYKPNLCIAILKSGKRKGEKCTKKCYGDKCPLHIHCKEKRTCIAILKSGKRKGEKCNNKIKGDGSFCRKHVKKNIVNI